GGVGGGRWWGGISRACRARMTFSQVLRSAAACSSVLILSRAKPDRGLAPPWHLMQYFSSRGTTWERKAMRGGACSFLPGFSAAAGAKRLRSKAARTDRGRKHARRGRMRGAPNPEARAGGESPQEIL